MGGKSHGSMLVTAADAMRVYDALMRMASLKLGSEVLGDTASAMRAAYEGSLIEGTIPLFWLELPLAGEPHSDLHVSYGYLALSAGARFVAGGGFGYQGLVDWFAHAGTPNTGIDLTFDLSERGIDATGAYVSFHDGHAPDMEAFCESIGCSGESWRCERAMAAFPEGWRVWYASPFPGRVGCPVRAAGLASPRLKQAFAQDPQLFRAHLERMGIRGTSSLLDREVSVLAALPVDLELRITLDEGGNMAERFDLSFYLSQGLLTKASARALFAQGGAGRVALESFECWGVADGRWRTVARSAFARPVPLVREDGSLARLSAVNSPLCFMLPWEGDTPLVAKTYPKLSGRLSA